MSKIVFNGNDEPLADTIDLKSFLLQKDVAVDRVVAVLNGDIIPADQFSSNSVKPGDELEVLRFVGGG